jgi:hypothetical protein
MAMPTNLIIVVCAVVAVVVLFRIGHWPNIDTVPDAPSTEACARADSC